MSTNIVPGNPAYVLVGGVSHTPVFWQKFIHEMTNLGFEAEAVAYPTCGENTENIKQMDEVIAIQEVITKYFDAGRDVVLVTHSYGGWPGSRAVKGLDKETRKENDYSTGIIEVVFIASFLVPEDASLAVWSYNPTWLDIKDGCRIPNETAIPLLFNDLNENEQKYWMSQLTWHRNSYDQEVMGNAPWKLSIPKTYVVTTEDRGATLDWQLPMLQAVLLENSCTWCVKSINSGHEAFLSQPANLAKVILSPRH